MITTRIKIFKAIFFGGLLISLLLPAPLRVVVQAEDGELVCDPLPEDPSQVLLCNLYNILNPPPGRIYGPGEDPAKPIKLPASGTWGKSGAYSPAADKIIVVTSTAMTGDKRPIVVFGINPKTFAIEKGPIQVSQDPKSAHAGAPRVVYNPDQKNFLAMWEDSRNGDKTRHTYARFISSSGDPVGSDFPVVTNANAYFVDLEYNWKEQKFVAMFEDLGNRAFLKTIDSTGNVGAEMKIPRLAGAEYEGQGKFAFNPHLNQYWVAITSCTAPDQKTEDCKAVVHKMDMESGQQVGASVILSQQVLGHNAFGNSDIAYNPHENAAVVAWHERVRGPGTFGRALFDDGALSPEFEILTPQNFPFGSGFAGPKLNFNQWTNTIFTTSEDDSGGTLLAEFTFDGLVLNVHQAIAPPEGGAYSAFGTFEPTNFITNAGAVALGSYGWQDLVLTYTPSLPGYYPGTEEQLQEGEVLGAVLGHSTEHRVEEFPTLISKIYIWSLGVAGVLALLMATAGGFTYMTAAGNAEKTQKGTEMIWGAVIGLALLFGAYLLLNTINPNLVNFSIKSIGDLKTTGLRPGTPNYPTGYVNKPTIPAGTTSYTKNQVKGMIDKYAKELGVDPKIPLAIAYCESTYGWSAQNPLPQSSASGVFQFVNKTWAGTPEGKSGKSVFDADANIRAAVRIIKERGTRDWDASKGCWGGRI